MMERLRELLSTMQIPERRKEDVQWLCRNLQIQNSRHMNFNEARALLIQLARKEIKKDSSESKEVVENV